MNGRKAFPAVRRQEARLRILDNTLTRREAAVHGRHKYSLRSSLYPATAVNTWTNEFNMPNESCPATHLNKLKLAVSSLAYYPPNQHY